MCKLFLERLQFGIAKVSFKAKVLQAREDAIVASVNRLLAEMGFDAMTVDEVAADVGIAKASLYKHFNSKEELAAAAMIRVLEHALAFVATLEAQPKARPIDELRAVVRWTMQVQLAGEMPSLPAQNSTLRAALMSNKAYLDRLNYTGPNALVDTRRRGVEFSTESGRGITLGPGLVFAHLAARDAAARALSAQPKLKQAGCGSELLSAAPLPRAAP